MNEVLYMHLPGGNVHSYDLLGPRAEFCSHDLLIRSRSVSRWTVKFGSRACARK